jgi:hypothetical protein
LRDKQCDVQLGGFVVQDGADGPVGLSAPEDAMSRPLLVQWDDTRIEWVERGALRFEAPPLSHVLGDLLATPPSGRKRSWADIPDDASHRKGRR